MTDRIEELNMILTHMWNSNFWYTALENASLLGLETKQALMRVSDEYDALRNSRAADHIATIKSQAAEISRLTVALVGLLRTADDEIWLHNTTAGETCECKSCAKEKAKAVLWPQAQPAQAETPVLSIEDEKMHWLATANRVTVGTITQMTDTTLGKAIFKTYYVAKVRGLIVGDPVDYKHETPEAAKAYGWLILKGWKDKLKLP